MEGTTTASSTTEVIHSKNKTLIIRLREKKVNWSEDVVNNEHMKKKSSKRCCIFHKKKHFGESDSDESDSDVEEASSKSPIVPAFQRHHA
jgi:protein phosphatase 1 regulatory subunit 11